MLRRHIDYETAVLIAQRRFRQQPSTRRWKERADRKLLETDIKKDLECLTLRTTRILDPNKRLRAHQALIIITHILSLHPPVPPSLI